MLIKTSYIDLLLLKVSFIGYAKRTINMLILDLLSRLCYNVDTIKIT